MDVTPLSLYIATEPGVSPDLETVARAAIAMSEALHESAYIIDPSLVFRVELISAESGSSWIKTQLRSITSKTGITKLSLKAAAVSFAIFFAKDTAEWTWEKVLEHVFHSEETQHLNKNDIEEIASKVFEVINNKAPQKHIESIYKNLDSDPKVTGVGAVPSIEHKPQAIVPRSEFRTRAGSGTEASEDVPTRTRTGLEHLTLISPVLLNANRKWRFSGLEGEFSAVIKDKRFIERLAHNSLGIPLTTGIQMHVLIETREEKIDGVWTVKERDILEVQTIETPPVQAGLDLSPPPKGDDTENKE